MCNNDFYINLGKNIKKRRKELRLTQQELADKLEMSLNFIGKIEVAFSKPSLDTLIQIANGLNTTVSDLTKIPNSETCIQNKTKYVSSELKRNT